jgi:hypothetical protein
LCCGHVSIGKWKREKRRKSSGRKGNLGNGGTGKGISHEVMMTMKMDKSGFEF